MQREIAAKSGKIAPFVFVNSGNFQQNWLKCVENIPSFISHTLIIHRILHVFTLSFAQFESAMFVFCVTSCIAFWDTHFVEETWKMAYFERVTRPRIKHRRVPSNHDKQWHCGLFVSGDNAHKSLRTYVARVRGSYRVITRVFGFLGERDSIETVSFRLSGGCFLVQWTVKGKRNVLWNRWPSLAFTALKKFDFSYFRTIKYIDVIIFWLAGKRARRRQLTVVWKRF